MRRSRIPAAPTVEAKALPRPRLASGAVRSSARKSQEMRRLRATKKPANRLADWTRSEPTTAGIAERSADGRRRLHRAGAGGRSTRPEPDDGTEIVVSDASTRGGTLTSSLRSEPRIVQPHRRRAGFPTDLYSLLTGSKLVRVNRATQEVEPWLAEKWTTSPDNLTYTLTLRDGVDLVRRHAVHLGRRRCSRSRRSTTRRSTACWRAR